MEISMKLRIYALIIAICILIGVGVQPYTVSADKIKEPVAESEVYTLKNDNYHFTIDKTTGCFKITDLKNKISYYSNPQGEGFTDEALYSQITVEYFSKDNKIFTLNGYEHSSKLGNMKITSEEDSIIANYTLGKLVINRTKIPQSYTEGEFEEILNNSELNTQMFKECYKLTSIEDDYDGTLAQSYPLLKDEDLYILSKYAADYKIKEIYYSLKDNGYTNKDLEAHNKKHNVVTEKDDSVSISISIHYTLTEDGFRATIPCESIDTLGNASLTRIRLLPYYETTSPEENGYMLLPDGSGALINSNNNRLELKDVEIPIYGEDISVNTTKKTEYTERATMRVFGIKRNSSGSFAVIEDGDAIATVYCELAGRTIPSNTIYAGFLLRPYEFITLDSVSSKTSYNIYSENIYDGNITVRYFLLDSKNSNYSDMATIYRNYLLDNKLLSKSKNIGYPLAIEFLGAIGKKMNFIGISYNKTYPLTDFNTASFIINELKTLTSQDLQIKYTGWVNGGLVQRYPSKLKLVSALGSKSDFTNFNKMLSDFGIDCYYGISLQAINESLINTRINIFKNSAKCLYKDLSTKKLFNLATMLTRTEKSFVTNQNEPHSYLLSPTKLDKVNTKFNKNLSKLNINNVYYEDFGSMLYSDFSDDNYTNRQQSKVTIEKLLANQKNYAVSTGDIYTLKNAKHIYDIPLYNSGKLMYDREIPFTQMVLHGCVNYSGNSINLSDNSEKALLRSVETGAVLSYTFATDNTDQLKNSDFSHYYSLDYNVWKEEISKNYNSISIIQESLSSENIIKHSYLTDEVTCTEYSNGTKVIVNYSDSPYKFNGEKISAKGYLYFK